jgi:hypothetical protein
MIRPNPIQRQHLGSSCFRLAELDAADTLEWRNSWRLSATNQSIRPGQSFLVTARRAF